MPIFSMTGFGRGEASKEGYVVTTEIKSVNNRFKETRFKMSSVFNVLEMELKNYLEENCKRGTFDISINFKKSEVQKTDFKIDIEKINSALEIIMPLFRRHGLNSAVSPTDFFRSEFFIDNEEEKKEMLLPLVKESFQKAIEALKISRQNEGEKLMTSIVAQLNVYQEKLIQVEGLKNQYPQMVKEKLEQKLQERLKDFKIDEGRLLQEVTFYLEKLEVDEEITRAKTHLQKFRELLGINGEVGRQIDFLLQELGRETNTLGSKSAHIEISSSVVEMKVQLEKIREQALNLE